MQATQLVVYLSLSFFVCSMGRICHAYLSDEAQMKKCKRECFVNHLRHPEVRYYCVAVIILPSKYHDVEDQRKASVKARLFDRAVSTAGS